MTTLPEPLKPVVQCILGNFLCCQSRLCAPGRRRRLCTRPHCENHNVSPLLRVITSILTNNYAELFTQMFQQQQKSQKLLPRDYLWMWALIRTLSILCFFLIPNQMAAYISIALYKEKYENWSTIYLVANSFLHIK